MTTQNDSRNKGVCDTSSGKSGVAPSLEKVTLQEVALTCEAWLNQVAIGPVLQALDVISSRVDSLDERLKAAPSANRLVSIKEAATLLALSERTIRDRTSMRVWRAYRCGSAVRVDPAEIRQHMAKEFRS